MAASFAVPVESEGLSGGGGPPADETAPALFSAAPAPPPAADKSAPVTTRTILEDAIVTEDRETHKVDGAMRDRKVSAAQLEADLRARQKVRSDGLRAKIAARMAEIQESAPASESPDEDEDVDMMLGKLDDALGAIIDRTNDMEGNVRALKRIAGEKELADASARAADLKTASDQAVFHAQAGRALTARIRRLLAPPLT